MIDHETLICLPFRSLDEMQLNGLLRPLPQGLTSDALESVLWDTCGAFFRRQEVYNPTNKPVWLAHKYQAVQFVNDVIKTFDLRNGIAGIVQI